MVFVLVVGGLTAIGLTRDGGPKAVVASHSALGTLPITAAPTGGLSYAPSTISVRTGLYDLTLTDGSQAQHTLYFDDPATLWPGVTVNDLGETKTARVFFGQPGDYTFYCAIPGHRAAGMQGVVHVTGPDITIAQAEAAAENG
jgi:plastocyanin